MRNLSNARRPPLLAPTPMAGLLPGATRLVLRGGAEAMAAAGTALRLNISAIACRSAQNGLCAALWMGPDEQLLLTSVEDGPRTADLLNEALNGIAHSVVDVSHRQIAFAMRGPRAGLALSAGCPLDLHIHEFPVGMCTRTLLGKATIVLWRTGAEAFHIEVWRSFADYAWRFLAAATRELAG